MTEQARALSPGELQQEALPTPLSSSEDPSGLLERAPALAMLLPDEHLASALARGDTLAVRASLIARLRQEPRGPVRETLQALLADRALFAVAESAPWLGSVLGTGVSLLGGPPAQAPEAPFLATRVVRLLGLPLWPLSQHVVQRDREGTPRVLGRVPRAAVLGAARWVVGSGAVALALAGIGFGVSTLGQRQVQLVNGLSRPVEVLLDGARHRLEPDAMVTQQVFKLWGPLPASAAWPGQARPFEEVSLEASPRTVYNVLGASSLAVLNAEGNPLALADAPEGSTGSIEPHVALEPRPGGWERQLRDHLQAGRWKKAGELAARVSLVDPTAVKAREEAARALWRHAPEQAVTFAQQLVATYPEDLASQRLAQELLLAAGREEAARENAAALARRHPDSVEVALLAARAQAPAAWVKAHEEVLARFPLSPLALHALARVHLAEGFPQRALPLLDEAWKLTSQASAEDMELRIRVLVSLRRIIQATAELNGFSSNRDHRSWELALLAARLDRIARSTANTYALGSRSLVPPQYETPEYQALFTVLTHERELTDEELKALPEDNSRALLELTQYVRKDLSRAVKKAQKVPDAVLSRLDPGAAAVLALEFSRQGEQKDADRIFGSQLALQLAREPLEAYALRGEVTGRLSMLPPDLLAAAYLTHGKVKADQEEKEAQHARWTDVLGGFALQALDHYSVNRGYTVRLCGTAMRHMRQEDNLYNQLYHGPPPITELPAGESLPESLPRPWRK